MLDRGVVFEDYGDYSGYLGIRHTLMLYEDKPNDDTVSHSNKNTTDSLQMRLGRRSHRLLLINPTKICKR